MQEFDLIIPSNKPEKARRLADSLPCYARVFDGSHYPGYAKLWNDCVKSTTKEMVIICGDKAKPTESDIGRTVELINSGFGSVQMHCLGFHGFFKDLINQIGWMDERYQGGGAEHPDFLLRHKEADIAYYESLEVEYEQSQATWDKGNTYDFFHLKWRSSRFEGELDFDQRILSEVSGPRIPCATQEFLPYSASVILTGNDSLFRRRMIRGIR